MLKICTVLCCCGLWCSSFSQADCSLRKDQDGIKVYVCKSAHSKFKFIKAEFTVTATAKQMMAMWLDPVNYNNWQYNTINAHLIKRINENELIYYSEIMAPWPISNRDLVVHLEIAQDDKTKVLTVSAIGVPSYIPEKPELIRIPVSISNWTVTPINETQVAVAYSMEIDPGGSVPAWMVNMVSAEAPYITFRNFKEKVKLKK